MRSPTTVFVKQVAVSDTMKISVQKSTKTSALPSEHRQKDGRNTSQSKNLKGRSPSAGWVWRRRGLLLPSPGDTAGALPGDHVGAGEGKKSAKFWVPTTRPTTFSGIGRPHTLGSLRAPTQRVPSPFEPPDRTETPRERDPLETLPRDPCGDPLLPLPPDPLKRLCWTCFSCGEKGAFRPGRSGWRWRG